VIASNPTHARRIAESIRYNLPNHRWATKFFSADTSPNGQGFVVAPMERAHGIVADHVIFTLGYGRTASGKVVHHFGPLSEHHGIEYYATAFTRARHHLTIFTAIHPQEVNFDNLMSGAYFFWELLVNLPATVGQPINESALPSLDPLSDDFVQHLGTRGAAHKFDQRGFIDLLLYNPDCHRPTFYANDEYLPVAVGYDGSTRYHHTPVRTRTRTIPSQLAKSGWQTAGLWAIDVFTDPLGVAETFAEKLHLPQPKGSNEPVISHDDHEA